MHARARSHWGDNHQANAASGRALYHFIVCGVFYSYFMFLFHRVNWNIVKLYNRICSDALGLHEINLTKKKYLLCVKLSSCTDELLNCLWSVSPCSLQTRTCSSNLYTRFCLVFPSKHCCDLPVGTVAAWFWFGKYTIKIKAFSSPFPAAPQTRYFYSGFKLTMTSLPLPNMTLYRATMQTWKYMCIYIYIMGRAVYAFFYNFKLYFYFK